jgi:hypothetical protein
MLTGPGSQPRIKQRTSTTAEVAPAKLAPARVLWYVSGAGHMIVIGCSELIEVRDGTPK